MYVYSSRMTDTYIEQYVVHLILPEVIGALPAKLGACRRKHQLQHRPVRIFILSAHMYIVIREKKTK
jgi:hypothetical protein